MPFDKILLQQRFKDKLLHAFGKTYIHQRGKNAGKQICA